MPLRAVLHAQPGNEELQLPTREMGLRVEDFEANAARGNDGPHPTAHSPRSTWERFMVFCRGSARSLWVTLQVISDETSWRTSVTHTLLVME